MTVQGCGRRKSREVMRSSSKTRGPLSQSSVSDFLVWTEELHNAPSTGPFWRAATQPWPDAGRPDAMRPNIGSQRIAVSAWNVDTIRPAKNSRLIVFINDQNRARGFFRHAHTNASA